MPSLTPGPTRAGRTTGLPVTPDSGYPGRDRRDAGYPSADYPGADYPGADYPGADYPGADYPGADYPGADYPGADYPRADYPSADYPSAERRGERRRPAGYQDDEGVPVAWGSDHGDEPGDD